MRIKTLKSTSGQPFLELSISKEKKIVHLNWIGFLKMENVIKGSEECLNLVKETHYTQILIDNRNIKGPWDMANEWYEKDFNKRLSQNGVKALAVIVSQDIFSRISLENFRKSVHKHAFYHMEIFENEENAIKWLLTF